MRAPSSIGTACWAFDIAGRTVTPSDAATMDFVVGRELYRHVERLLDRLEDVADEIQGIAIDHA